MFDINSQKLLISFEERVARFDLGEFQYLFSKSGLELIEHYGDHQLNPFDVNSSPRLILFARKKIKK